MRLYLRHMMRGLRRWENFKAWGVLGNSQDEWVSQRCEEDYDAMSTLVLWVVRRWRGGLRIVPFCEYLIFCSLRYIAV